MRTLLIIITFFLFQKSCFSQATTFFKKYNSPGVGSSSAYNISSILPCSNNEFIATSMKSRRGMVIRLDSFGEFFSGQEYYCSNCSDTTLTFGPIIKSFDSNYLVIASNITSSLLSESVLMKIDSAGNIIWAKKYNVKSGLTLGYNFFESADSSIYFLANDNFIKLDKDGTPIWRKRYYVNDTLVYFSIRGFRHTPNGNFLIAKRGDWGTSGLINSDIALIKIDFDGNIIWSKYYDGSILDEPWAITEMQDESILITGQTFAEGAGWMDMFLMKTDSDGNFKWLKTYGDSLYNYGFNVEEVNDSKIIILGSSSLDNLPSDFDIVLMELDSVGAIQKIKKYGDSISQQARDVYEIDGGYLIHASQTNSSLLMKTNMIDSFPCFSLPNYTVDSIVFSQNVMQLEVDSLIISSNNINIISRSPTLIVISDYCSLTSIVEENSITAPEISIFPNPFYDFPNLVYNLTQNSDVSIEMYNAIGDKVETFYHGKQISGKYKIELTPKEKNFGAGVYFVKITIDGKSVVKKVIQLH